MNLPGLFFRTSLLLSLCAPLHAAWVWVEGETPSSTNISPHPWYAGQIKKDQLSGGAFLAHYDASKRGEATYTFNAPEAGTYTLWLRANVVRTSLQFSLNGAALTPVLFQKQTGQVNLAPDGAPDLRFIAWSHVGDFPLKAGSNTVRFVMNSELDNHGSIDCFVFTTENFAPLGVLKPDQLAAHAAALAEANKGWAQWPDVADPHKPSPIDLRPLNETFAGENGRIIAHGEHFVHSANGHPVRFWAVNGPPRETTGDDLVICARLLAKRGVNLIRIHGAVFNRKTGALDNEAVTHRQEIVSAMRNEGIYSLLSIYFPLWLAPENGPGWREGYNGNKHPFSLLYFEPEFQELYRSWWRELLTRPDSTGRKLIDDPAIMALELINEDSFFFWTFKYEEIPEPQMRKLEQRFGDWAKQKHGSLEKALAAWRQQEHPRDDTSSGRLGIRALYDIFTHKSARDQDTAAFLMETQRTFYTDTVRYLRELGYKGMITASNWLTANDDVFGPLEKYSYLPGDFIDRHGYFGANHRGNEASWSIRVGHTYSDVSALRFDSEEPGKPKRFRHPAMDVMYNGKPSTLSETTWNRPNRYRGEAPMFYAVYGALQGTDAIMNFSMEGLGWRVKPGFFMQPWNLTTPTQMGQFPAAALIYRKGLIKTGDMMADLPMKLEDALALKGSKLVQRANLDELRKADVSPHEVAMTHDGLDPLIHFVGRTNVRIDARGGNPVLKDLSPFIDRKAETVLSSTKEVKLDYGKGVLYVNAPAAQAVSGHLKLAGPIRLRDVTFESALELGHIVVVSLDERPLETSKKILVQAMSEEKPAGFSTETSGEGIKRITQLGQDPWLFRELEGTLRFRRADASRLKVTALDFNGYPTGSAGTAAELKLRPGTVYYVIEP